jgi:hypothetical protein
VLRGLVVAVSALLVVRIDMSVVVGWRGLVVFVCVLSCGWLGVSEGLGGWPAGRGGVGLF